MARNIHIAKKMRLAKRGRQTRWAPVWVVLRANGPNSARRVHPGRYTEVKRSWRRSNTKV